MANNHGRILKELSTIMPTWEGLTTFEVSPITMISENTSIFFYLCIISMRFIKQIYTFICKTNYDMKNDMAWYGLRLFMDFTTRKLTWQIYFQHFQNFRTGNTGEGGARPPIFCVSKRKKRKQREKRKSFKATTIKKLSARSKYYCFSRSRASGT